MFDQISKFPIFEFREKGHWSQGFIRPIGRRVKELLETLSKLIWRPQFLMGFKMRTQEVEQRIHVLVAVSRGQELYLRSSNLVESCPQS